MAQYASTSSKGQDALTDREKKQLTGPPLSNPYGPYDRLFPDFQGGDVFAYDWDGRDIKEMLRRSGKARSTEQVLTLPIRRAAREIQGTGDAADLVRTVLDEKKLDLLVSQCTAAVAYRKAFFELVWTLDAGKVVLEDVAWRPPTACEAGFDEKTGRPVGFRQRVAHPAGLTLQAEGVGTLPGYVRIPANRAFIYTHGQHRDPLFGVSDLDVAYWCWETQQKIFFLWFQFLENQSIPATIAYGDDLTQADTNADKIAEVRSGGVIGVERPTNPDAKVFDILESSGKGAEQFQQAVRYLDTMMVSSVLAGFTELADTSTASRTGSYALSADQSEFFLQSRQAVADEIANAITDGVIAPMVRYNFGSTADIPKLVIGPLSNKETDRALDMLKAIVSAQQLNVPGEFVDELVKTTASHLGLDEKTVTAAIAEHAKQRAEDEQVKREQAKTLLKAQQNGVNHPPAQPGAQPGAQKPPARPGTPPLGTPKPAAQIGQAVRGAAALVEKRKQA